MTTTLHGHIHNGTVILDDPTALPEGTPVSVQPLSQPAPSKHRHGSGAAILETLRRLGPLDPEAAADWDRAYQDLQRSKQESLALEIERDNAREKLNGDLP
ncbi:MAG TPA: hypothetical protein VFE58_09330 [Tepidisphaeraceae bacterium]|nr:hypothetical protein [Tepidisphaeraceae bacterium]